VQGTAGSLTLTDANALVLNGVNVGAGAGAMSLTVGGALTDTSANQAGAVTLAVAGNAVLDEANDFTSVQGTAANLTVVDANALVLNGVNVGAGAGAMSLTVGGALTDTAANQAGAVTLAAAGQAVTLDNANDFASVQGTAGPLTLIDANDLLLNTINSSGSVWIEANRDVTVGRITTPNGVWINAGRNIIDADHDNVTVSGGFASGAGTAVNITADRIALTAGGDIGAPSADGMTAFDALDVQANTVAASGQNVAIYDKGDLTLGSVTVVVGPRNGTLDGITAVGGGTVSLMADGSIIDGNGAAVNITCGTLIASAGNIIGSDGLGKVDALEITVNGGAGASDIWVNNVTGTDADGTVWLYYDSVGGKGHPIVSAASGSGAIVIENGTYGGGDRSQFDGLFEAALDFAKDTPELKSRQGVFGSPIFVHDQMDINEAVALGIIDFLFSGKAIIVGDPELEVDEVMVGQGLSPTTSIDYRPNL
jgi:hypothetical protein